MSSIEVISGFVTAPSTTETALTMAAGNSLTIRNFDPGKRCSLLQMWNLSQGAGIFKVRSAKWHDNVQGIRMRALTANPIPLLARGSFQQCYAQDVLTATLSGSATAGDIEQACFLVYYEDLPGSNGRFFKYSDVKSKIVNLVTQEVTITGGSAGGYSGEVAINSTFDLLRANTDYCVLGYEVNTACSVVRIRGVDTGNIGVGGPGNTAYKFITNNWFAKLSDAYDLPLVPVFNSANKAGTLVDVQCDENGGTFIVNLILGQM
jgi:hypothetical protein